MSEKRTGNSWQKVRYSKRALGTRWLAGFSLFAVALVFCGVVVWVTLSLRGKIRAQLMERDAQVFSLLIQHELRKAESEYLIFDFETLGEMEQWAILLETASAEGVFAVQLFSQDGMLLQTTSERLLRDRLSESLRNAITSEGPQALFRESVRLSEIVELDYWEDRDLALISLYLPLVSSSGELLGIGAFLMDGAGLEEEFSVLDGQLAAQAAVAMGLGVLLIAGLFGGAWWMLERANLAVRAQAERLARSNAELAMLARTSAVGSVAAHLIHGLKNPLAGIRAVVSGDYRAGGLESEDWEGAREAANRMQRMVHEVVALLQDSSGMESAYELDLEELAGELERKFKDECRKRDVELDLDWAGNGELDSHRANVVLLVLSNLVQNAIEACGAGGTVSVNLAADGARFVAEVRDDGPGIDASLRERLFSPLQSRKEGGAGIGLAISRQLAMHLGGDLRYVEMEVGGACFELTAPLVERAGETLTEGQ